MNLTPKQQKFLRTVPVFNGLKDRSLESVAAVLHWNTFPAGAAICAQGELGRTLFVIEKGEVEVLRTNSAGETIPIVRLAERECFGEMALVELDDRSATVVATHETTTCSLNNVALYNLFHSDNFAFVIILQNICQLLSRRLRKADSRIADLLGKNPLATKSAKPIKATKKASSKPAKKPAKPKASPKKRK